MGGCCSCFKNEGEGDLDERAPLLNGSKSNAVTIGQPNSLIINADQPQNTSVPSSINTKPNEQTLLAGIATTLNKNVIDITAIDSKISSGEYMDRVNQYSSQTEAMTNSKKYNYPGLKSVSDDPLSVLTVPLRPYEEVNLIRKFSQDVSNAFNFVKVYRTNPVLSTLMDR